LLPGPTQVSIPNCISISAAVFAQLMVESPYTLQCAAKKLPFMWWDLKPHLMVPWAHVSPHPKRHLIWFSPSAIFALSKSFTEFRPQLFATRLTLEYLLKCLFGDI